MFISDKLSYSTVRIVCIYKDGSIGSGTGFICGFLRPEPGANFIPVLITNKHVIRNAVTGMVLFTTKNADGTPNNEEHFTVEINNGFEKLWDFHPDPEVDLCAMRIGYCSRIAHEHGKGLYYVSIFPDIIPSSEQLKEITTVEDVLMIGYPIGLWDEVNNKPIFRKGVTATSPLRDYCGKKEFLIDMACFPGSSGSPVFICQEGEYLDAHRNLKRGIKVYLIGVLYAGPQMTIEGNISFSHLPTMPIPKVTQYIPINLGCVISSVRIKELEDLYRVKYKHLSPEDCIET